ncbi:MAG TPA: flagellar hook-length control protein FliK [Acidimicrobiales bacterium]|nr:flagellar hook-length control protein FliK [Acidimicrobiales bacterium]
MSTNIPGAALPVLPGQPVGATTGVAAPGAAPAPGPAPNAAEQVVSVLAPLRVLGGNHQVTLSLTPEGLGTVRATVTMGDQHLVVQLVADSADGREVLRQSLPQLRALLDTGTGSTSVSLADGADAGAGSGGEDPLRAGTSGTAPNDPDEDGAAVPAPSPAVLSDRRLVDVRL